ncbi:hypothetical protein M513_10533 [Trichuris suis]|uniref:Uncharacterized protein n=1 Tax=Trichuris suis TaxID=68888 RepID=A0A085LUF3_9BILA|nr:hypothetical protein M513_10533 [Trichuris suis]
MNKETGSIGVLVALIYPSVNEQFFSQRTAAPGSQYKERLRRLICEECKKRVKRSCIWEMIPSINLLEMLFVWH